MLTIPVCHIVHLSVRNLEVIITSVGVLVSPTLVSKVYGY